MTSRLSSHFPWVGGTAWVGSKFAMIRLAAHFFDRVEIAFFFMD